MYLTQKKNSIILKWFDLLEIGMYIEYHLMIYWRKFERIFTCVGIETTDETQNLTMTYKKKIIDIYTQIHRFHFVFFIIYIYSPVAAIW